MVTTLVALGGAVVGIILGLVLCFVINLLRYGEDDEPWHYDELLYEGIVALCAVVTVVTALLSIDPLTALWAQFWS